MKLQYQEKAIRAKKDAWPKTNIAGRTWKQVTFTLNGEELEGLMSSHWLYFRHDGQTYKLNTKVYEVDVSDLELSTREVPVQTLEEKKLRRQERRKARRARLKELESKLTDYSDDLE